ncbi:Transposase [Ralstonia solanacearum UW551]|uniref:Transposase n=1 Tax=Ralstonia solanacearum (strain UW551) TaxID=342110 RepID=A0AB33V7C2_RALSU|nr:Transposase [Ralstonia solanacearum UW551]
MRRWPAPGGASRPDRIQQIEARLGSKRHLVVDRRDVPLALMVTGANRHDSVVFEALVDAIPSVPGLSGRPRCRPDKLHADKGYDFARCRQHLRKRGICPRIARRGIEKNDRLGRHRWVVERTHAWLAGFGKLRIRFERSLDTHLALLTLACVAICARFVDRFC